MTKWHKGPPPSIGWWPASVIRNTNALRWWNGERWSNACVRDEPIKSVAKNAARKAEYQHDIEWTDRPASWPERSRT